MTTAIDVDKTLWTVDLHLPADKFNKYEALEIIESLNLKNTNKNTG